jgi:hypothetical protein
MKLFSLFLNNYFVKNILIRVELGQLTRVKILTLEIFNSDSNCVFSVIQWKKWNY